MIPINLPNIGEEEIKAVVSVMRKGPLTSAMGMGPQVTQFEKNYAEFAKAKYAIAVNSGTAALHATLLALGLDKDSEVILPSFTFVATAEAVVLSGAKPVFVDIDPLTCNISTVEIEKAINKKTKVILPVDLYGLSAQMKTIQKIARDHNLYVVEDAAQAHGASHLNRSPGTFADAACWSLYASKNMTTGEGGVVTTNNDELAEKLRMIRTHGEKAKYASQMLGHNYRMSEIQAAIGIIQLKKLAGFLKKRRSNAERLSQKLIKTDRIILPKETAADLHSWYLYTVRLVHGNELKRDKLRAELHEKGIGAESYYLNPVHTMPFYRENFGDFDLPQTIKASKQVLSLPVHPSVTMDQIDFIGETVVQLISNKSV